ncbi:MAG: DMT family transporter [Campylobacterota bacterium]|nr:DMT family transporter [Campylobacterota bacterium]
MTTISSPKLIDYFWLILLASIWGSAFVAIEYSLTSYSPFMIAFGRIFMAAIFVWSLVYIKKLYFPRDIKTWLILILIGILNNAMPFYLISWGQQYISASTTGVMLAIGPFIALILSHFITHDEKFTFLKLFGVLLGFIGVFILLGDDFLKGDEDSLYGKFAMIIAVSGYILSGFLMRKISHIHILVCSSSMLITASVMMLPFVLFIPFDNFTIFTLPFLSIIYLSLVPTAIASIIRINLVQKVGVQFMSQVAYIIPIFAIFWSWVFFDTVPKYVVIIALVFILIGLFIRKIKE